jgi:hypothetical protein
VHSTVQNPFQDVMAQRDLCGQGWASHAVASHAVVVVRMTEGRPAAALHGLGIHGQHVEAKLVAGAARDLPALELQQVPERESVSSQAKARRHTQLRSRARSLLPAFEPALREASRASKRTQAANVPCAFVMCSRLSGPTSQSSGCHSCLRRRAGRPAGGGGSLRWGWQSARMPRGQ